MSEMLYGENMTTQASIQVWEQVFNAKSCTYALYPFESDYAGRSNESVIKRFVRAEEYSVPMAPDTYFASDLNTVQMLQTQSRRPSKREYMSSNSSNYQAAISFDGTITPAVLNFAYDIDSNVGHPGATQAVYETIGQGFSPSDLTAFQQRFGLPVIPVNKSIGGHARDSYCIKNINDVCDEGSLDIQYIMAISQSPTTYYYTDLIYASEFLMLVANSESPPLVISISYGLRESYRSYSELDAFNVQAIKLSAMGVTIVAASGDDGAPSTITDTSQCAYTPEFFGTSPYVLSIGATKVRSCYERTCNDSPFTFRFISLFVHINHVNDAAQNFSSILISTILSVSLGYRGQCN